MKKFIFFGLLGLILAFFSSCSTSAPECKYHVQTLDLTVVEADWLFDQDAGQFYYHFDVPEITAHVYNYGNWTVCREYNFGTKDAYQVSLPESRYMWEEVTESTGEKYIVYFTQHIDYRVGIGYVEVQLTNSDYVYDAHNPETMHFRLQLIY